MSELKLSHAILLGSQNWKLAEKIFYRMDMKT